MSVSDLAAVLKPGVTVSWCRLPFRFFPVGGHTCWFWRIGAFVFARAFHPHVRNA